MEAEIQGGQGAQVGHHNTQYNQYTWVSGAPGAGTPRPAAGQVVAGEIPQEPVAFQPRPGLLEGLRSGGPGVSVVCAVTGMRGVGKTQVAAAFARECVDAGWRLVAWVNAQNTASVLAGLAVVAARLGIAPGQGAEDAAAAVRNWLEADGRSCLLVFDNAPGLGGLCRFVPAAGRARVVVTTTDPVAGGVRSTLVPVGVFSVAEAVAFLTERTGLTDEAGAREVALELGWLPLGLAQAGAVIAAQRLSYAVYLERLRSVPVGEYLAPSPGDPYPHGVAEAVLLSLDAVADDDVAGELRRAVMDLVAVLSPAGVSRSLLHAAGSGVLPGCAEASGVRLVDEAVGWLAGRSLLAFGGVEDSVISAHRLVMRVVRERAVREGTLEPLGMRACVLLGLVMGSLGEPWENRAAARDVIQQVISLHQHLRPCLDDSPTLAVELLSLRRWALHWLNELGDAFGQAVEQGRSLLTDCERVLGDTHPDTLGSRNNLGYAYQAAGRLGEAIPLYERTLTDREHVLGDTHPDTLTSRNNLAYAYQAAGRLAEAIPLYERTLTDREHVLGDTHPDTLISRNNLAHACQAAGRSSGDQPSGTTSRLQGH
jgi:Tetratricopeptide repeat